MLLLLVPTQKDHNIRTAPKEDSNTSAAQVVYGMSLMLPPQLPAETKMPVEEVQQGLATNKPIPTRHSGSEPPMEVPAHLATV